MKIVLTGSLGHINRPLVQQLVAAHHAVTVISHSPQRQTAIRALGATPAIGSIADQTFLTRTFTGADAVYLMITNATGGNDLFAAGRQQADLYANAVRAAGVTRVVNLSSVGANLGPEVGSLHIYNIIESVLTHELSGVNLTFIRPTGMFYNLFNNLTSIQHDHVIYTNSDLTQRNSWVAPQDIAPVVAQALTAPAAGVTSQYVASDERSFTEVAASLGTAIGLPDLKAVQISDATMLTNLTQAGMPTEFATQYVKTTAYERDHDFYADYRAHRPVLGPTKLTDFAQEFAQVYVQS
ncbi:NAD(P)H-binding protein [Levilactobacillus acidifarinae]|uniref:NAD(P)-binding domain-containing protein n=1 Tax=Levilactobacillus acidifarinae DSM 19394 = JCM 15949 TaxID=1423715 RepID=A0A0R1LH27_9LACO|nr:NAD(P)H-binding protein [Levilactobacillus acidifarinae]KRK95198.1 hypothetical protein FD25_GL001581 [Levilactobacillus acidifarinae DSM 19394]GEO70323.1 hypothetical protein LAC03_22330 [Levilactobacillus acidifarinae]